MFLLKKGIFFIFFFLLTAPGANAILAPQHEAFIKDWTPYHQNVLKNEPDGSFAIFQLPNQLGTYCLASVEMGVLKCYLFRHDDDYIKKSDGSSIGFSRNRIDDVNALVERRNGLVSVPHDFNKRAFTLKKDERNRIIELHAREPWRAETMKDLRREILSERHRWEENTRINEIIELLHRNEHFTKDMADEEIVDINAITSEKNALKNFFDSRAY